MATIVYSRDKKDPEQIYLPLAHGGFIMLVEGAHKYEEHAGYGLKNSTNPTVQHYLNIGKVNVILDGDTSINHIATTHIRQFAPLNTNDFVGIASPKIMYPPINDTAQVEVSKPTEEVTDTPTRVTRRVKE
jgi:hypothetical protein